MKIHIVKQGDTLFELSKKYNVPLQKLIEANPQLANPDRLNIGDKVKIPAVAVTIGGETGNVYKHVVKQGDTLFKLSKAWGLPLQALIAANPQLSDPNKLKIGEVVNIPSASGGSGGGASHENPGTVPGAGGKKNTAPIKKVPTDVKPEMTAPKPVKEEKPKTLPVQEKPKEQPIHVEPPKKVPMEIKVEVEQIKYETAKFEPVKYEPVKYAPMKGESLKGEALKGEAMKGEPVAYNPYANMPMKGEPAAINPYANMPMKGEPATFNPYAYGPMKGEPVAQSSLYPSSYPNPPMPHYAMEQPASVLPAMGYAPSPCGCSGSTPYTYQPETYHPFYQYPVAAEPVFYDNVPYMQQPATLPAMDVNYPGISNANAPLPQAPDLGGAYQEMKGSPVHGYSPYNVSPQYVSPEAYGNMAYPHSMGWQPGPGYVSPYGAVMPGYQPAAYPYANHAPVMPGYNQAYAGLANQAPIANKPLKGEYVASENLKGNLKREPDHQPAGKAKSQTKKNVKISGGPAASAKGNRGKSGRDASGSRNQTSRSTKASTRHNPWINS
ncbi:LysM peptidoglycan-binding domain-containing protein [Paenibacillus senegalimassiliensis]|uniref:LysM peptidoglycan-binding domain-containing protein n=1 Tax=Paenibacillus senegalimassiliensis TaxID=1737426 RepID=UPI00073F469E|nr:LysM peptidoglycan-binding domain-containing protein [Paenibacillus senegalimassiliensis]